jgi:hypothetical protein
MISTCTSSSTQRSASNDVTSSIHLSLCPAAAAASLGRPPARLSWRASMRRGRVQKLLSHSLAGPRGPRAPRWPRGASRCCAALAVLARQLGRAQRRAPALAYSAFARESERRCRSTSGVAAGRRTWWVLRRRRPPPFARAEPAERPRAWRGAARGRREQGPRAVRPRGREEGAARRHREGAARRRAGAQAGAAARPPARWLGTRGRARLRAACRPLRPSRQAAATWAPRLSAGAPRWDGATGHQLASG